MRKYIGESALLINTLIWGATFVIIKSALSDISPMMFVGIRFSFAALVLLPFSKKIFQISKPGIIQAGIGLGILYFLGFATQTIGLQFTTATKSGFITGTFVIFTPVFQLLLEKKVPDRWNIIGVIIVIIGLLFLSSKGESVFDVFNELGSNFNVGDFFTLLCAFFWGWYLVRLDMVSKKYDFMPLVFWQILISGVGGFLFVFVFSVTGLEQIELTLNSNLIFAVLYTAILATVLATSLQTKYQKFVSPTKAGIILSFEPIFAALTAFFVLSEKISYFGIIGCLLIFSGLIMSEVFAGGKNNNER